jgi:hypothetical protein
VSVIVAFTTPAALAAKGGDVQYSHRSPYRATRSERVLLQACPDPGATSPGSPT